MKKLSILAVVLCTAFIGVAQAQPKGNPVRGRDLAATCMGCHGIEGYTVVYPTYHVPKLGGQHAQYIVNALEEYKNGKRSFPTMHAQASELTKQQMWDVAAFFQAAGKHPPAGAQNNQGGQ
ncbi:MAG TPA: c-type cytochrome [Gammaproteobacteria bacterium]|nr:c-type cytochrome [Gammaproteobacteria bacterium]